MDVTRRGLAIATVLAVSTTVFRMPAIAQSAFARTDETSPEFRNLTPEPDQLLWDRNNIPQNDALPLEYKLNEWRACRQVNPDHFINNTFAQSEGGIFGAGLQK
jgi:hypothetical protein